MKRRFAPTVAVAISVLMSACDTSTPDDKAVVNLVAATPATPSACMVALAPHAGEGDVDRRILDYQQRAVGNITPLDYLDRLGWAYVHKARVSHDPGYYTLAGSAADCIAEQQPDSAAALLLRGHALHAMHRFAEAEAVAQRLVGQRDSWSDYALLGDVLMEQGKLSQAVLAYGEMMDRKPGQPAYARVAHMRWLKGDLAGAIEAMKLASRAGGSLEATAWGWSRLAAYELQAGDMATALGYADAALRLLPDYAPALLMRGRVLLAREAASDAVDALERATARSPLPEYRWVLIEALYAAGREERAAVVERELATSGERDDSRTYSLYLATRGMQTATALRLALAEIEIRTDVFTLDALAWAHAAHGDMERAAKLSARALAEGTADARLRFHAGVIASALGHREDARRLLREAMASEQTLLPSERSRLHDEFAVL